MKHVSFNHVRTHRQRHAFSVRELAYLLDHRGQKKIARLERGQEPVSLRSALALQVLFGQEPRHMFPDLFEESEDAVMRRAKALVEELEGRDDPRSTYKREFLEALPRAASSEGL